VGGGQNARRVKSHKRRTEKIDKLLSKERLYGTAGVTHVVGLYTCRKLPCKKNLKKK